MKMNASFRLTVASAAMLLAASVALAGNTWTGGGADNNWSTAANWGGTAPSYTATLIFDGSTRLSPNNDTTGTTLSGSTAIQFNSTAGAFTLGGNAVTLGGSVNFSGNPATVVTQTISLPMTLSATRTFYTQPNGVLAVSGGIGSSGNFNLEKQNAGTMILSGVNTFSNQFYITQGTVRFGGNGVLANTNNLYIQPRVANSIAINSIVDLAGTTNDVKAVVLGHQTPSANGLQSQAIDSVGGGLLRLANYIQYYPGGSSYSNAMATISCAMTFPNGNIYVDHSPSNAVDLLISGPIRDGATASKVTKQNPGILALAGTNTYTGATAVNAGVLLVNSPGSLNASSAVTVSSGAALGGNGTINGTVTVNAGGTNLLGASGGTLTLANATAPTYQSSGSTYTTFLLAASASTLDKISASATTGNSVANVNLVIDTTGLTGPVPNTVIYSAGGAITGPFHSVAFASNPGGYNYTVDYSTSGQIKLSLNTNVPTIETVSGTTTIGSGGSAIVTLHPSQSGVTYQLYAGGSPSGSPVVGTGNDLNWIVSPASNTTYTVQTTTAGGYCATTMNGSAVVTVTTSPSASYRSINVSGSFANWIGIPQSAALPQGTATNGWDIKRLTVANDNNYFYVLLEMWTNSPDLNVNDYKHYLNFHISSNSNAGLGWGSHVAGFNVEMQAASGFELIDFRTNWSPIANSGTNFLISPTGPLTNNANANQNYKFAWRISRAATWADGTPIFTNNTISVDYEAQLATSSGNTNWSLIGPVTYTVATQPTNVSTFAHIAVDGSFNDWTNVPVAAWAFDNDWTNGMNIQDIRVANDETNLYLLVELYPSSTDTNYNDFAYKWNMDTDNSSGTGLSWWFPGMSADYQKSLYYWSGNGSNSAGQFGQWITTTNQNSGTCSNENCVELPTGSLTQGKFELQLSRSALNPFGLPVFMNNTAGSSIAIGLQILHFSPNNSDNIIGAFTYAWAAAGNSSITYGATTNFTYNGSAQTPTISFSGSTGVRTTNYVGTGSTVYNSTTAPTGAGTYYVSNTVAADVSYFGATNSQSFTISPKAASVTANPQTKTYGDANPALTAVTNGAVNGDVINVTIATTATQYSAVGVSNITVTAGSNPNYTVLTTNSTLTINPKAASVTADAKSKTYGSANPLLTATVAGTVNSDLLNYTLATDATQFSSVGVSNITVTLGSNPNYSVSATNSTLTINPASTFVGASSTKNPSGYHDAVAFLATLPTDATGSVVFSSTNGPISTNSVSSGSATSLSITNLPRGTNVITVAYLGDGNYLGSTTNLEQIVTNHPPVANDVTYYRAKGLSLKIAITNLLSNVTDMDGDAISLQSVGAGLTNATIMTNGTRICYLPGTGAGSNDNDVVSFAVSDGFGGTATANILVSVYSAAGPAQMSLPTNGVVNITFFGIPNYTYIVQTTTNLSVPWWTLSTNTASTNGSWQFTDPNATNAQQYYRSAQP